MQRNRVIVHCLIMLSMGTAIGAHAATVDFEPPTYAIGDLAGQDGWEQLEGNPTFTTILGSEGGSISGFSSASIVGGAGGTGGAVLSVYKNAVVSFDADGTDAFDLNVTFLYRKTQEQGFGGLYLGNDGLGDSSAYVRVNGTTIEAIEAGGNFVNLGTYTVYDIVEFSIDIDLDRGVYAVSMRNDTLGEDAFSSLTPTPLSLNGQMSAGDVAVSMSGQLGQSIYDEVTLTATPNAENDGPVAAYGFDEEADDAVVLDTSGNANDGLISGATRTTKGRFGNALAFDGIDDWVTIADADFLDLTTGMTLEAWVYPIGSSKGWSTVLLKEQHLGLVYALYANSDTMQPVASLHINVDQNLHGRQSLQPGQWTHLAATYDGSTQRLYVDGEEVASYLDPAGSIQVSDGALRIGGNESWLDEFFEGYIDEVRVYDRALRADEIHTDMDTPVTPQSRKCWPRGRDWDRGWH
jgi:hypothetical protein